MGIKNTNNIKLMNKKENNLIKIDVVAPEINPDKKPVTKQKNKKNSNAPESIPDSIGAIKARNMIQAIMYESKINLQTKGKPFEISFKVNSDMTYLNDDFNFELRNHFISETIMPGFGNVNESNWDLVPKSGNNLEDSVKQGKWEILDQNLEYVADILISDVSVSMIGNKVKKIKYIIS